MRLIKFAFVALVSIGVAWVFAMHVSAPYRHNRELTSKLPLFLKVIAELEAAAPSDSLVKVPVPDGAREMVAFILAEHPAEGRLAVEFLTGGGFPVKHRGFLFLSSGGVEDFPKMASRWPKRTPMRDHWLYIAD